jgi:serine/threonine-protein kinase
MSSYGMDPGTWQTLNRLLDQALEVPARDRERWIAGLPPELEALKPRLRALLAHAAAEGAFGTIPKLDPGIETESEADLGAPPDRAGDTVGPYVLMRLLAEGGMGAVWLAERSDGILQRPVALKFPRGVWSRPELVERMAREREILASLNHPHIARLYDAGLASDGQPYLALEYVEGRPIDAHARAAGLDTRERLRLFSQIAQAVAHAHARLVVHRDLKPSNILVTGEGEVRLLDFGIAKLLEEGEARETELTRLSGRALTLAYASPEQVSGEPIGVASDVYSLGVVLYELLTGSPPYRPARDSRRAAEDAILNAHPAKPSEVAADAAARRALRGDLDTILLKALKKKPEERYPTVNAFADDVERWLQGRPVVAQPDNFRYRLRKFVWRNKLAVGAAASIFVAVLAGAAIAFWQARVAVAEKERAEEVKEFISSIFRDADPYTASSGEVPTVVDLLKQAREKIDGSLGARPELRVELLNLVGESLLSLQESDTAEEVVRQAVEVGRSSLGADDPRTLQARILMSQVHRFRGRTEEMRAELDALVPALRASAAPSEALVVALKQQANLAIDEGRYPDAEAAAREASEMALTVLGPRHPETTKTAMLLALSYLYNKKAREAAGAAEQAYHHALEMNRGNEKHPLVIEVRAVLGRALGEAGDPERAVAELERAVRDASEVFGESAMMVGFFSQNLSLHLLDLGEFEAAIEASDLSRRIISEHAQPESYTFAAVRRMRGMSFLMARRSEEALSDLTAAADTFARVLGPAHEATLSGRAHRGMALAYAGSVGDALEELEAVVTQSRESGSPAISVALRLLGTVMRLAGEPEEALRLHEESLAAIVEGPKAERERLFVLAEIGLDQVELARYAEAAAALEQALERLGRLHRRSTPLRADALLGLGRARMGLGRLRDAREPLEDADELWKEWDPESRWAREAALWLEKCLESLGRS